MSTDQGMTIIEGEKPKCPKCGGYNHEPSYGLAMGGIGTYDICFDCGHTYNFIEDKGDE